MLLSDNERLEILGVLKAIVSQLSPAAVPKAAPPSRYPKPSDMQKRVLAGSGRKLFDEVLGRPGKVSEVRRSSSQVELKFDDFQGRALVRVPAPKAEWIQVGMPATIVDTFTVRIGEDVIETGPIEVTKAEQRFSVPEGFYVKAPPLPKDEEIDDMDRAMYDAFGAVHESRTPDEVDAAAVASQDRDPREVAFVGATDLHAVALAAAKDLCGRFGVQFTEVRITSNKVEARVGDRWVTLC